MNYIFKNVHQSLLRANLNKADLASGRKFYTSIQSENENKILENRRKKMQEEELLIIKQYLFPHGASILNDFQTLRY